MPAPQHFTLNAQHIAHIERDIRIHGTGQELAWHHSPSKGITDARANAPGNEGKTIHPFTAALIHTGTAAVMKEPEHDVEALLHTHPHWGAALPSKPDVSSFLHQASKFESLKHSVILHISNEGKVMGYTTLTWNGKKEDAAKVKNALDKLFSDALNKRRSEMTAQPERFTHILPNDSILTGEEYSSLLSKFIQENNIQQTHTPIKGHKFNGESFVKIAKKNKT